MGAGFFVGKQDMIGFKIRPAFLQDVEVVVDVAVQANPPREQQHSPDSSRTEAPDPIDEPIVDVARSDLWRFPLRPRSICNPVEDMALSLP
jgi:hypothetical protein